MQPLQWRVRQLMSAVHLGWRRGVANGWPCFAKRNAVQWCEASPTAFQRGQLQWQDLGKKSKAKVKLWSRHVNSGSKNLKKYSTRSFPFDLKIIIFDVTAFQKKIMSSLQQCGNPAGIPPEGQKTVIKLSLAALVLDHSVLRRTECLFLIIKWAYLPV